MFKILSTPIITRFTEPSENMH